MAVSSQSLDFVYLFPENTEIDASGAVALRWADGESPFGAARALALNNAHATIQMRPHALTADECRRVIDLGDRRPRSDGRVEIGPEQYRVSHIGWIEPAPDTHWLFHRLGALFAEANRHYGFELVGFVDALQYTVYGPGERFEWHLDLGPEQTSARKLSMTVQLTPAAEYSGGTLEFINSHTPDEAKEAGTATIFPSYLVHRVSPIESGVRRSLVAWAYGSSFR